MMFEMFFSTFRYVILGLYCSDRSGKMGYTKKCYANYEQDL